CTRDMGYYGGGYYIINRFDVW
nr:immunoglobulin heavy chain junction region [Macaca mulatta]MOV49125.1 immunoglobulin heavy chain junction region [Macaca mulatta]MOV50144.1 immunoglobulin heavy chain junction region [Macaca mulatta]MOV50405.1 immunoglobulin heavy chain junction region [Macaca mulatta]MOV50534.1 immunoglobulin heavy chain junction region [Macaca mulatta]